MLAYLTKIYGSLTAAERIFFAIFDFLKYRPQARVISVGNLSMGGTGKTPVLFELLDELKQHRCCVLSRGYRSPWERSFYHLQGRGPHPSELTDEALLLNSRFPEVPIFLGKNRHHAAIIAEKRFKPELMLLDDGFQYRRLHKDIDLVLFDAMADFSEAQLIPAGRLREPAWRLRQAQAVLLTRCETVSAEKQAEWLNWLKQQAPKVPVIRVQTLCDGLYDWCGNRIDAGKEERFLAFSAIGRPAGFYSQLRSLGLNLVDNAEFRDHHRFTAAELQTLAAKAAQSNLRLVCTEKDFCKISPEIAEQMRVLTLRIRTLPVSGQTFTSELAAHGIKLAEQKSAQSRFRFSDKLIPSDRQGQKSYKTL